MTKNGELSDIRPAAGEVAFQFVAHVKQSQAGVGETAIEGNELIVQLITLSLKLNDHKGGRTIMAQSVLIFSLSAELEIAADNLFSLFQKYN